MQRRFILLLAAALLAILPASLALAEETAAYSGPAWNFGVALADISDTYIALASSAEPLAADFVPSHLTTLKRRHNDADGNNSNGGIYMAVNVNVQLVSAAANALMKMVGDAEIQGVTLYVRQGYRSYADQAKRYAQAQQQIDAVGTQKPGECDWQTGLAVTLVGREWRAKTLTADFASSPEAQWLLANGARYGFVLRYPQDKEDKTGCAWEPWHLRFVGTAVAGYLVTKGECLEEFHEDLQKAYDDFAAAGGDVQAAIGAVQLPDGPAVLDETGPDGDHEITLFHD